jgi:hypothetical protein
MAKKNLSVSFKNAVLDLEEGTISEFGKEEVKTYRLFDILRQFTGQDKFIDITIKESSDIPSEEE